MKNKILSKVLKPIHEKEPMSATELDSIEIENVHETKKSIEKGKENPDSKAQVRIDLPNDETGFVYVNRNQLKQTEFKDAEGNSKVQTNITVSENAMFNVIVDTGKVTEDNKPIYETRPMSAVELRDGRPQIENPIFINNVHETKTSIEKGQENPNSKAQVRIDLPNDEVGFVSVNRNQLIKSESKLFKDAEGNPKVQTNIVTSKNAKPFEVRVDTGKVDKDNKPVYETRPMSAEELRDAHIQAGREKHAQIEAVIAKAAPESKADKSAEAQPEA